MGTLYAMVGIIFLLIIVVGALAMNTNVLDWLIEKGHPGYFEKHYALLAEIARKTGKSSIDNKWGLDEGIQIG